MAHTTGVPSAPRELASLLLDSQRVQLFWAPPADTGQGNGAPSQAEPLLRYEVWAVQCNFSESASGCAAAGGGPVLLSATADALGNATVVAGLTSARRYVFYLRAVNRAGGGDFANATQVTLDLPSAPQNFTAIVSAAYGPLRVALSWAPPANTGQGLGSQSEPILGYRLYVGDDAGALNGSRGRLLSEGLDRTFLASFPAARREPYYFMVAASNLLGYGNNVTGAALTSEQAVALPTAPRNLTATVAGVLRVRLAWELPADTGVGDSSRRLVAFGVEVSRDANFSSSSGDNVSVGLGPARFVGPGITMWNETLPASGPEPYYFRVFAVNDAGASGPSNVVSEQGVALPGPPVNLTAAAVAENAVLLVWHPPLDTGINGSGRDIIGFRVTISVNGSLLQSRTVQGGILNTTFSNLDHMTVYSFAVYAANDAGESSSPVTILFQPVVLPSAPEHFVATVRAPFQILLTWARPSDTGRGGQLETIRSYLVEQDLSGPGFANASTVASGINFCESESGKCSLPVNFSSSRKAPYWFRVSAYNLLGFGNFSVISEQSIDIPSAPMNVFAMVNQSLQILLTWTGPTSTGVGDTSRPLLGYIIQQSYGDLNFSTPLQSILSNTTFQANLKFNKSSSTFYFFRVLAYNDAGISSYAGTVQEQSVDVPSAVDFFRVMLIGPLYMGLTWNVPNDTGTGDASRPLKHFILSMAETNISQNTIYWKTENTFAPTMTAFNKSGFQKGITYFFRIQAENDAGLGIVSSTVQVDAVDIPFPPSNFTAVVVHPFQINLSWTVPVDTGFFKPDETLLTGFILQQSDNPDFSNFSETNIRTPHDFSYTVSGGLVKGTSYYFRLWSVNVVGQSQPSYADEQSIDVPSSPFAAAAIVAPLQINISWIKPEDTGLGIGVRPARPLKNYILEIVVLETPPPSTVSFVSPNLSYSFPPNISFLLLQSLLKGKSYFARVRAENSAGLGNFSNIASRPAIDKPSAPVELKILSDSFLLLSVSWVVPSDTGLGPTVIPSWPLLSYRVQIAIDSNFSLSVQDFFFETNITSSKIGDLIKGTLYFVRVFANNIVGESPPSPATSEHLVGKPAPPVGFTVKVSAVYDSELVLTWSLPDDTGLGNMPCFVSCFRQVRVIEQYLIEQIMLDSPPNNVSAESPQKDPAQATDVDFLGANKSHVNGTTQQFNASNLMKGFTYYYRVFALNSAGISDPSNVSFEMAISRPSPVQNASLEITGHLKLTLKWVAPADNGNGVFPVNRRPLLHYLIQVDNTSSTGGNFELILFQKQEPTTALESLYSEPILYPGIAYSFRIAAVNAAGQGTFVYQGSVFSPGRYQQVISNLTQTAITLPGQPINYSTFLSNPGEITVQWKPPVHTGTVGQLWPLLRYIVEMDTNESFYSAVKIFEGRVLYGIDVNSVVLPATKYYFVQGSLVGGVFYHFRVISVNEAGSSPPSATMKHIALYNPPAAENLTAYVVGSLMINVSFTVPRLHLGEVIIRYILEMELLPNGFVGSPFVSLCYQTRVPPCVLTGDSPYDLGIAGSSHIVYRPKCPVGISSDLKCTSWRHEQYLNIFSILMTGLARGQRYYFRVLLQNEAGFSAQSQIISQQAITTPSPPKNFILRLNATLSFLLTWNIPIDTGNASSNWPLTMYGVQMQARDNIFGLSFRDSDIVQYAPGEMLMLYLTDQVNNVRIQDGTRYFVRIFAMNEAGRGEYSTIEHNGPVLNRIIPNSVPSFGGFRIKLTGFRFGDTTEGLKIKIGQAECRQVAFMSYQSSISCAAPAGISGKYNVQISVRNLTVLQENAFGYDRPRVKLLKPSIISIQGGDRVTVLGENFGGFDSNPVGLIFPEHEGPELCAKTVWTSDSSIECTTAERKTHAALNNSVVVKVGTESSIGWVPGSHLVYADIPTYFQCVRETTSDCYNCVFEKCFLAEFGPQNAGAVPQSMCELKSLEYCSFSKIENAIKRSSTRILLNDKNKPASQGEPCGKLLLEYASDKSFRYIKTNSCPEHANVTLDVNGMNHEILAQEFEFIIPVTPSIQKTTVPLNQMGFHGVIGVAVNGIPFYSNFGSGGDNILDWEKDTLDSCGGHTSASGIYHYHTDPLCLYRNEPSQHSPLLGFMLDGVPIYGKQDHDGSSPLSLDECSGHIDKVQKFYHYHWTDEFPHHNRCFKGCLFEKSVEAVNWSLMGKFKCDKAKRQPLNFLHICELDTIIKCRIK